MKLKSLVILGLFSASTMSFATMNDLKKFKGAFPDATKLGNCKACHATTPALNAFGTDYKSAGKEFSADLLAKDSDGDGVANSAEIKAGTFPGDSGSH